MPKIPSQGERRARIRRNLSKLSPKQRENLPLSQRRSSTFAARRGTEVEGRMRPGDAAARKPLKQK